MSPVQVNGGAAASTLGSVPRPPAQPAAQPRKPARRRSFDDETPTALVRSARAINRALTDLYPDAHCELDFTNPLQLLVATILSAQCTDKRVNLVTPTLFANYPTAADYAAADRADIETIIMSTGFFRAKTTSIMGMAAALCERFNGEVPPRLKDLVTLPGVGRKTANVVLGNAFGIPGLTVDTHVLRLTEPLPLDYLRRPGQGRDRRRGADPAQRVDAAVASRHLAWTTGVPRRVSRRAARAHSRRCAPRSGSVRPMKRPRRSWSRPARSTRCRDRDPLSGGAPG